MVSAVDRTKRDGEYGAPVARAFVRRIEIYSVVSRRGPLRVGRRSPYLRASVLLLRTHAHARASETGPSGRSAERRRIGGRGEQSSTVCVCEALPFLRVAPSGPKIDKWTTSASSSPSSVVPRARFPGCPRATEVVDRLTSERAIAPP